MQNTYNRGFDKFKTFVKQNLALIIIIACVIAITTIVIVAATNTGSEVPVVVDDNPPSGNLDDDKPISETPKKNPNSPVDIEKKRFDIPVSTYTAIGMNFTNDSDNMFVFNGTLNMWTSHRAIDFLAEEGSAVCAMRAGTVSEVGFSYALGNYVTVDHGDGILATYASLDNATVSAGQVVVKGDKLGGASTSAMYEFSDGAHLHLAMTLNGVTVNPWDYLLID